MTDKEIEQAKQTISRIKEGYPVEKYQGYKHHAEHTKDCDALFLVGIIEKYDLLHSVSNSVRKEIERRRDLIISEPDGIVRETMISNLAIDL